jgi:uncharacterized membrane protein
MLGLLFALLSGFSFALGNIFIRRGTYRSGESFTPVPITLFLGTAIFGMAILISGKAGQLVDMSWTAAGALAVAGLMHYHLGRTFGYVSILLIGANRAAPIHMCSTPLAAIIGIVFFEEQLTASLPVALLLVVGGVILISTYLSSTVDNLNWSKGSLARGVSAALATAVFWGTSPVLVKIGLQEVSSPLVATFVSYSAAAIAAGTSLLHPKNSMRLKGLNGTSFILFALAGIATSISAWLRYLALGSSPVSLVVPLTATHGLFIFPLSMLANRKIETFSLQVVMGAAAVVAGIFIIFWIA